tara:strand:+ start:83 stop:226 length:144 start_codon:yes stop_codon:yes gene_type:complete
MFKLKDEYNKPDVVFADLNELSEEHQQMIKDNYEGLGDIISKYFDWI